MKHHASAHTHTTSTHTTFLSRLASNLSKEFSAFLFLAKESLVILFVGAFAVITYVLTFTKDLLIEFGFLVIPGPRIFFEKTMIFFMVLLVVIIYIAFATII